MSQVQNSFIIPNQSFQQPTTEASTSTLKLTCTTQCCLVCGQENAKMHYGVFACLGCKGFFRRALKKLNEYECFHNNNCIIDKSERTSCRACRLQKCLDVGMDPAAVRPDRTITAKQQLENQRFSLSPIRSRLSSIDEKTVGNDKEGKNLSQRLPVDLRTMLMTLQNIEAKVVHGDTARDAADIYPLRINNIREIIEEPNKLIGRRTEMRYEPYRMAKNEEFSVIVYRRLIAAVDWVEMLSDRLGALVKSCFGPLTLFKCSARTAVVTENEDMLCLCNFAYVPRNISKAYNDTYHLDNGLVERLLNELVTPFRRIHLSEEEIVLARDLSEGASNKIYSLRDRIFTTLNYIIKEYRQNCNANTAFGNLLLYLPIITALANAMSENLRFAQTFSSFGGSPLLTNLFGCFPVSNLFTLPDEQNNNEKEEGIKKGTRMKKINVSTQTEWTKWREFQYARKRRWCPLNSSDDQINEFCLLQPPCSYALTEMFDDCAVEAEIRNEKDFDYEDECKTPLHYFEF